MSGIVIETSATRVETEEVYDTLPIDGSGTLPWMKREAAWVATTYARAAFSIAATRVIWSLIFSNDRRKKIYEQAGELLVYGRTKRPYGRPEGFSGTRTESPWDFGGHDTRGANAEGARVPPEAVFKGTVDGIGIYHHGTKLDPRTQFWPCPVLYRHPCETCAFFVASRGGNPWCAAVEKLKLMLKGQDDGQDLYEIRDFIRTMM